MMIANKVNVMGQEYQILKVSRDQYKTCEGLDGWCDAYGKKIYYVDPETDPDSDPIAISPEELVKQVLRHEIVHAFLTESGLAANSEVFFSAWATNEEMVDWIAWNGEKLHKAWKEAGLVD
jgi:hypothetical protein